jgi:monoterpene epsilon-lactone hydrolase
LAYGDGMASLMSYVLRWLHQRSLSGGEDADSTTIEQQREGMDNAGRYFRIPKDVQFTPIDVDGLEGEWLSTAITPQNRVILYLHGGSFRTGSIKSHRFIVAPIVKEANTRALMINYRLAPEYPFPAGVQDCHKAYRWLLNHGYQAHQIVIMGDSAGGGLTISTLLAARDAGDPLPAGAVGMSPALDAMLDGESITTRQHRDFVLHADHLRKILPVYWGTADRKDPLLSPVYADLHGLPPILIHVGSDEILLSDATTFAERAAAADVNVTLKIWPEMWHVFQLFYAAGMPEARQAVCEIGAWIRQRLEQMR